MMLVPAALEGHAADLLGAAPFGQLTLPALLRGERAQQPEPVRLGHVALADRDQAQHPGLGVEQAVVILGRAAHARVVAVVHQTLDRVVEPAVVGVLDQPAGGGGELRERRAHHHEARGQPSRVDRRDEVAAALEARRIVVVVEKALEPLEPAQGRKRRLERGERCRAVEEAKLGGGGDRHQPDPDGAGAGVVADPGARGIDRAVREPDLIDRQPVLAIDQRGEAAPGIGCHPHQEGALVRALRRGDG